MKKIVFSAIVFVLATVSVYAKVELPAIICDNMVLQQQTDAALWGKAAPGKTVTVIPSWSKQKYQVKADSQSGKWMLRVSTPAAGGPYEISFSDGEKVTVRNVLIGEVWYCSGQSNMYMRMSGYPSSPVTGAVEAAYSAKPSTPIRIFEPKDRMAASPEYNISGEWKLNTPENVINASALAWFFASFMQKTLDVPVGMVVASSGGSSIQAWLDRETVEKNFHDEFDTSVLDKRDPKFSVHTPCGLYNAMVAALEPYTFKGMLWYQGCTNRDSTPAALYTRLQTEYVGMMRERFQNPDAGFYFVQLSPFWCHDESAFKTGYFLEAQQKCLETIPHSGMVTTTDLGIYGNIHPKDKKTPAERLAYLALQNDYGIKPFDATAPTYKSMRVNDPGKFVEPVTIPVKSISVTFEAYNSGMAASVGPRGEILEGFEIAGEDRVFHKAKALTSWGPEATVWSEDVPEPVAVRYCFRNWGPGNLTSNFGIPAAPFRTDSWDDLER